MSVPADSGSEAEALVRSEARFRALVDASAQIVWTTDGSGEVREDSPSWRAFTGQTYEQWMGRGGFEAIHSDDRERVRGLWRIAVATRTELIGEYRIRHVSGQWRWTVVRAMPLLDPDRNVREWVGMNSDITERKQAEEDQRFLMEVAQAHGTYLDVEGLLVGMLRGIRTHLDVARCTLVAVDERDDTLLVLGDERRDGLSPLPQQMTLSIFANEDARREQRTGLPNVISDARTDPRTAAQYDTGFATVGFGASIIVPVVRDGVWVASMAVSAPESRPWQAREVALLHNVAERTWLWREHLLLVSAVHAREKDELVRRNEERFRLLVDGIKDSAIIRLDVTGHVASWSAGAQRLKGYDEAEILGRHFSTFYPAEDVDRGHPTDVLRRAMADGSYAEDGWRIRKDGSRFWANVNITALNDAAGHHEGFAKVTRDFTERRQAEAMLEQRQAQLQASLKEREVLLQEVHHRVKNNLQVIASLINMQIRQIKDPSARSALEECRTRVQAIALIHEKLYQSKDYARVPFSEYATTLATNIFHATGISPATLSLDLAIQPVSLPVDKAIPCGLILNELMTNALKHAFPHERAGTIRVMLRPVSDGQVQLSVADDGVGIPARFDAAQSRSLGMQLVTTLVAQLEGRLEIGRDGGTTFSVLFPSEGQP